MGRVYAAEHPDRPVIAVKLMHESLAADPAMANRMAGEAEAARRVAHRNVVRVVDSGTTSDGMSFIAMELVRGAPLSSIVRDQGPLPLSRVRAFASQVLAGLGAIHRAGFVHGDLKSDNVIVDPRDRITIIDFGLARRPIVVRSAGEPLVSGTPEYMAPEVIRGEPLTPAADLYAAGVILYELLTGSTPFGGGTPRAVFEQHLVEHVIPPTLRCPDRSIPVAFEEVILRALAKDPAMRHHDAELFAVAVERTVPANCHDAKRSEPGAGSPIVPTRERKPAPAAPRRRLAAGTSPHRDSALARERSSELETALAARDGDAIVAAALALVDVLVGERRLSTAAGVLEDIVEWLSTERIANESSWRLLLMLAAIDDGLGSRTEARRFAGKALAAADQAGSSLGRDRAQALLRRFETTPHRPAVQERCRTRSPSIYR